jgi:flagellin-like protein
MKKRGISPVIATVLLIVLVIIIILIIWLWARSFISESLVKNGEPADRACELVNFDAEYVNDKINLVNNGNVPIYGITVMQKGLGSVKEVSSIDALNLASGETKTSSLTGVSSGDTVILVPVVLGENDQGNKIAYPCDSKYGLEISL